MEIWRSFRVEEAEVRRQMSQMHRNFEGILEINELPAALFVIDTKNERLQSRKQIAWVFKSSD